jgi:hypothetical protein
MQSHFLHLLLYTTLVSAFFGVLARRSPAARFRLGAVIWCVMVAGALAFAYLMFPFPLRTP